MHIDPKQIIANSSLEEIISAADGYFHGREGHLYLYQKPFHNLEETPAMLGNLGDLFRGAKLARGLTVLDFAAGSCWLSKILVEFGCKVVSCDVSPTALDIGRRLFATYPPVTAEHGHPRFMVFDGRHLDLPDGSVDRILVNDAFHHVPNPVEVLREFHRVLRPDGVVAMSEPGRLHSRTPQSQAEMRNFNVIEDDIVIEDLWEQAQRIGFREIRIAPVLRQPLLSIAEYRQVIAGGDVAQLRVSLQQETLNYSIFFLHKSDPRAALEAATREEFDERYYLGANPDVAAAVAAGAFASGWDHYETHGRGEGRPARRG